MWLANLIVTNFETAQNWEKTYCLFGLKKEQKFEYDRAEKNHEASIYCFDRTRLFDL